MAATFICVRGAWADTLQDWSDANGYGIDVAGDELGLETFPPGSYRLVVRDGHHAYPNPTCWYESGGAEHLLFGGAAPGPDDEDFFTATATFGSFIESNDGTFYTEQSLNDDAFDHAFVFVNTKGRGYIVASEDLWAGGDEDYTDRIFEFATTGVAAVGGIVDIQANSADLALDPAADSSGGWWAPYYIALATGAAAGAIAVTAGAWYARRRWSS